MDAPGTCSANDDPCDDEVKAVLAEFGGDAHRAIAALLHDIAVLAADKDVMATNISCGFLRGQQPEPPKRRYVINITERLVVRGQS